MIVVADQSPGDHGYLPFVEILDGVGVLTLDEVSGLVRATCLGEEELDAIERCPPGYDWRARVPNAIPLWEPTGRREAAPAAYVRSRARDRSSISDTSRTAPRSAEVAIAA